jgi:hypothetical protein
MRELPVEGLIGRSGAEVALRHPLRRFGLGPRSYWTCDGEIPAEAATSRMLIPLGIAGIV